VFFILQNLHEGEVWKDTCEMVEAHFNVPERGTLAYSLDGRKGKEIQGGSNMTGTDLCVNKPPCPAAVRP